MPFQLVYDDHDLVLPLALDILAEERLVGLMGSGDLPKKDRADLARRITDAITTVMDVDVTPPTEKQVKYAIAIARELSLTLRPEVLQHRTAMTAFLGEHAPAYRQRRGRT